MSAGKAAITVESGKNLKNVEFFGKQDPYVVLEVGGHKYKTEVAKNGGSNPVFNQTFEVPATGQEEVSITVMDDETLIDELIGHGKLLLTKAKTVGQDHQDVQLFTKDGRDAGHLTVTVKFADVAHAPAVPPPGVVPHPPVVPAGGVPHPTAPQGGHCAGSHHTEDHHNHHHGHHHEHHEHHHHHHKSSSDSD